MSTPTQAVPLLHRFLLAGLAVLTGVFAFLRSRGIAPLPPGDSETTVIGYTFAALSIVLLVISLLLFKPRIPRRKPQQTIEQYWSSPDTQHVLVMWFLMEGAGLLSAIGFFISGELAPIATLAIALVVFWMNGPNAAVT